MIQKILLFCLLLITSDYVAETNLSNNKEQRSFEFSYNVVIEIPEAKAESLEVYLPIPQSDTFQQIQDLKIDCPFPYTIEIEKEYGNKIFYMKLIELPKKDIAIGFNFLAVRKRAHQYTDMNKGKQFRYLQRDSLVPITGKISDEANKIAKTVVDPAQLPNALYEHLISTVQYDKTGLGWGRGDAVYACDARKGNCTDFHSLFIGMARASKIPSRFMIGFSIPPDKSSGVIKGYHCWAEYFDAASGWIPVDISEAHKHPEKKDFYNGKLDPNRVQFSVGRDIKLGKNSNYKSNYFIYPVVFLDGEKYENVKSTFAFKDVPN